MKNHYLAAQFKVIRKHRTLKEVSEATGISVSFLSDIENDRTKPAIKTLIKLCDYYQIPVAEIFSVVAQGEKSRGKAPQNDIENHGHKMANLIRHIMNCHLLTGTKRIRDKALLLLDEWNKITNY